jgi:hypothetical protein
MRTGRLICRVALLFAVAAPAMLHAQFQDPTPDELKMTADPKAPGAAAVYLYREEATNDSVHTYSYYERIKVLSEKGKELATVHKAYVHGVDNVIDIQGRTIHADGTIIPLTAKPSDLMDFKAKEFQVNNVVFTLPSVEVGSILEYRLTFSAPIWRVSEPSWDIQSDYFTHKAHFMFHPYVEPGHYIPDGQGGSLDRLMTSERLAPGTIVAYDKSKQIYSLDLTEIPAVPDEDWMPPMNTLKWRVEYYYTNAHTPAQFWTTAEKHWALIVEDFSNPTGTIKKAAEGLVAPNDSDEQKARKLYTAVQKLDNTAFSRRKSEAERKKEKLKQIHKAEDVWKQQSGDEDEIALLYVSLARAAGLKVRAAQVVNRDRAMFDTGYLSTGQLDDYLAIVEIEGKDVYLDPGQKMCPFGSLHWKHTLASGIQLTGKGADSILTPSNSYKNAVVQRLADLTIDPSGSVTGTVRYYMSGPDALYWRQLSLENDQDEVKKQFNDSVQNDLPEGVQADFDRFSALENYDVSLVGVVKVTGNIGTSTGKHFFLPGLFFEARAKHPFVAQDTRSTPIDVHYAKMETDNVTYHTPAGFNIENVPHAADAAWPEHAVLKIAADASGDQVSITRTLAYNFVMLDHKEYPTLHDFYQKVAAADQQQLVLTRAPAGKGN